MEEEQEVEAGEEEDVEGEEAENSTRQVLYL